MPKKNWLDGYLQSHYYGFIAGNYDKGCHLYFKDINNFIQNVGRFSDIEIMRYEGEILLDTSGVYINRIWPDLSWDHRESIETKEEINFISKKLGELRENDGEVPEPIPKVTKFMKEMFGQEIVDRNMEIIKNLREEEMVEDVVQMRMM